MISVLESTLILVSLVKKVKETEKWPKRPENAKKTRKLKGSNECWTFDHLVFDRVDM